MEERKDQTKFFVRPQLFPPTAKGHDTMKKDIFYIEAAQFDTIIAELGLKATEQKGFVKVEGPAKGRQVYVAKTKRVGRVDLSGFEMEHAGWLRDLGGEKFGAVKQQLSFARAEGEDDASAQERILTNFRLVLEHMVALPAAEPIKRVNPVSGRVAKTPDANETDEAKAKRRALIAKFAKDKGVAISGKSIAAEAEVADEATSETPTQ